MVYRIRSVSIPWLYLPCTDRRLSWDKNIQSSTQLRWSVRRWQVCLVERHTDLCFEGVTSVISSLQCKHVLESIRKSLPFPLQSKRDTLKWKRCIFNIVRVGESRGWKCYNRICVRLWMHSDYFVHEENSFHQCICVYPHPRTNPRIAGI